MPILFEWYKFVGLLVVLCANIQRNSPALRPIAPNQYHVLIGLLSRCARLMLANIALSHEGRFGETTAIIDRCIFESALNVSWLCTNSRDEKFKQYFATSLKVDIEFRDQIESNIKTRGEILPIERRMIHSIEGKIVSSELSEEQIRQSKKMPPVDAIMRELNLDRIHYVVSQKIGSHHVHGTWSSLLFHYLEEENANPLTFRIRDHDCATHINQFMYVCQNVLQALRAYIQYALEDGEESSAFLLLFGATESDIMNIYQEAIAVEDLKRNAEGSS